MWLGFLRHGIAEDLRPGLSDADRDLTPEGRAEMARVGRGLLALDLRLDMILTSPLKRAVETADIVARSLKLQERVVINDQLAYDFSWRALQGMVERYPRAQRVLLVGHEPTLSATVSAMIGGGSLKLKKGSLAVVKTESIAPGAGELTMLVPPSVFGLSAEDRG